MRKGQAKSATKTGGAEDRVTAASSTLGARSTEGKKVGTTKGPKNLQVHRKKIDAVIDARKARLLKSNERDGERLSHPSVVLDRQRMYK